MLKRIIYLSDSELRVFLLKGKHLTEEVSFKTANEDSENKFAIYLGETALTPIELLVDTTQEEYQVVNIPHVRGKEHSEVMANRKMRFFKDMPYICGIVQKREKEGRRDDIALFMAITNADWLGDWLGIITRFKIPLLGIYSVPLLSESLLKNLPKPIPKARYILFVAGLRQSFFIEQKLQFSRLIPSPKSDNSADFILKQVITIRHYLESARILPQTELGINPLFVVILADGVLLDSLRDAVKDVSSSLGMKIYLLANSDFAYKLTGSRELKWELPHFVALQFLRRIRNHYAFDTKIGYLFFRRLRLGIYVSATLLLFAAIVASTIILNNAFILQEKADLLANKTTKRLTAIEELKQKKPDLAVDIGLVRAVVDVGTQLKRVSPRAAWVKLSVILNRHPDLFIENLDWYIIDFVEMIKLQGKIKPFDGNYQKALVIFKKFVNDLELSNFENVNVVVSPYNSKQILRGELGLDSKVENQNAPFVVEVVIRH